MNIDDIETSDPEDDNLDDDSDKFETDLDEEIRKSKCGISGIFHFCLYLYLYFSFIQSLIPPRKL